MSFSTWTKLIVAHVRAQSAARQTQIGLQTAAEKEAQARTAIRIEQAAAEKQAQARAMAGAEQRTRAMRAGKIAALLLSSERARHQALLHAWREVAMQTRHRREATARLCARLLCTGARRALHHWRHAAGALHERRRRTALACARLARRSEALSFARWAGAVAECRRREHVLLRCVQRLRSRSVSMALGTWRAHTREAQRRLAESTQARLLPISYQDYHTLF